MHFDLEYEYQIRNGQTVVVHARGEILPDDFYQAPMIGRLTLNVYRAQIERDEPEYSAVDLPGDWADIERESIHRAFDQYQEEAS